MRIVVFSDSHNNPLILKKIVEAQQNADLFIHLGDGENDYLYLVSQYPNANFSFVGGNCDFGSTAVKEKVIVCEKKKILLTHGHLFGVKLELDTLERYARNLGVNIVLFGHTHKPLTLYKNGLFMINPGSVFLPKSESPSYATIDIVPAGIVPNIIQI